MPEPRRVSAIATQPMLTRLAASWPAANDRRFDPQALADVADSGGANPAGWLSIRSRALTEKCL